MNRKALKLFCVCSVLFLPVMAWGYSAWSGGYCYEYELDAGDEYYSEGAVITGVYLSEWGDPARPSGTFTFPSQLGGYKVREIEIGGGIDWSLTTSIVIPEGVMKIESLVSCEDNLTSIKLPSTIVYIGDNAFSDCTALTGWH